MTEKKANSILGVVMEETAIVKKLLEHDDRFEKIEGDIGQLRQEMLSGFDEVIVILKRLDEERIFTTEWIKRIDTRVEKLEKK